MTTKQTDKLRYMYLGKTPYNHVTILESDLSPEQIIARNKLGILVEESFTNYSTNWSGYDDLDRTCKLKKIEPTDFIALNKPLTFYGSDYDHGHEYEWSVVINEIDTVKDSIDK